MLFQGQKDPNLDFVIGGLEIDWLSNIYLVCFLALQYLGI
jgi:hypothetical protein